MEIASALSVDGGGVGTRHVRGRSQGEPFRDCLGFAGGPETVAKPPPEPDTVPVPEAARLGATEPADDDRQAPTTPDLTGDAGDSETEEAGEALALAPLPTTVLPTEPPAVHGGELVAADSATGTKADSPTPEAPLPDSAPVSPSAVDRDADSPDPGASLASSRGEAPAVSPADSRPPLPTERPAPDSAQSRGSHAASHVPSQGNRPARSAHPESPSAAAGTGGEEAAEGPRSRPQTPDGSGRPGAERLWSYWLRHGGGGSGRGAHGGGESQLPGTRGPGRPTALAAPGGAPTPWPTLSRDTEPVPGLERGSAATTAPAVETRGEPATTPSIADLGSNPVQGVERHARAAPPEPRGPIPPPQPPQQVANAVRVAVLKGGEQVTIQLEPEALGKVHVVLMQGDDGVRASFRVENPLTQQALQADTPQLKQALEARGVNVAHISVELGHGDRQERDPLGRHAADRRRRPGAEDDGDLMLDELPLRPEPWRPWGFEARA